MLPKKHLSGAENEKKKKEIHLKIQPLKGSLTKYFTSSSIADVSEKHRQRTNPEHENSDVKVNADGASTKEQINLFPI